MVATIRRVGDALAVVIDPSLLEQLGIDAGSVLEVTTEGETIILKPMRTSHHERIMASARKLTQIHHQTLKKLAE